MNKNVIVIGVVVVLIVAGVWYSLSNPVKAPENSPTPVMELTETPEPTATPEVSTSVPPAPSPSGMEEKTTNTSAVKEFTVTGKPFSFTPSTLAVNKGDKVKITFVNQEGFHDFKIDEFNVATKQIKAGAQETVEFVADKAGSFEYYCSVGSHRAMGMKGTLTVK